MPSTRPYLLRALHHWCSDHGYTPFLAVAVDGSVRVPMEHVRDGQIVLNLSHEATQGLDLGNETIAFKARFGGVARESRVPVERVLAIYARENGQGMAFPVGASAGELTHAGAEAAPDTSLASGEVSTSTGLRLATRSEDSDGEAPPPDAPPPRPALKRVK
ncbi:MAG: ClpXP protease specificity-enhancing factor [Inhella sp.]